MRVRLYVLLILCVFALVPNAAGQSEATDDPLVIPRDIPASPPRTLEEIRSAWGTTALAMVNISAWGFQEGVQINAPAAQQLFDWSSAGGNNAIFGIFRSGGTSGASQTWWFAAPLDNVPAGAQIMGMVLEGCDTTATGSIWLRLVRLPSGGTWASHGFLDTGGAATPGCALFGDPNNMAGENLFVDKLANTYLVNVALTTENSSTLFRSVRVFYRLRISPAPATATFSDVPPSHPFYQFIEALAASGITAGCTAPPNPNYCPDATLTRGQMAVFLARALGLHFPN